MKRQAHLFGKKLLSPLFPDVEQQPELDALRRVPSAAEPKIPISENEDNSDTATASSDMARKLWSEAGHF